MPYNNLITISNYLQKSVFELRQNFLIWNADFQGMNTRYYFSKECYTVSPLFYSFNAISIRDIGVHGSPQFLFLSYQWITTMWYSFLSFSLSFWIQNSFLPCLYPRLAAVHWLLLDPTLTCYLTHSWGRRNWFLSFPKAFLQNEHNRPFCN